MTNPSISEIQADCGDIYDAVNNGTTAVKIMIVRAQNKVKRITGTTTGADHDDAIRDLSNAFVCNQVLGGVDPVSKNVAGMAVGEKKLTEMRDRFYDDFKDTIIEMGYSLTGNHIIFKVANQ